MKALQSNPTNESLSFYWGRVFSSTPSTGWNKVKQCKKHKTVPNDFKFVIDDCTCITTAIVDNSIVDTNTLKVKPKMQQSKKELETQNTNVRTTYMGTSSRNGRLIYLSLKF